MFLGYIDVSFGFELGTKFISRDGNRMRCDEVSDGTLDKGRSQPRVSVAKEILYGDGSVR